MEPGRTLTLAEKGGAGAEVIVAAPAFRLVATMNPGGDYGKKELSPALSNRFTQIWVPALHDEGELASILASRLPGVSTKPIFWLAGCSSEIVLQHLCKRRLELVMRYVFDSYVGCKILEQEHYAYYCS